MVYLELFGSWPEGHEDHHALLLEIRSLKAQAMELEVLRTYTNGAVEMLKRGLLPPDRLDRVLHPATLRDGTTKTRREEATPDETEALRHRGMEEDERGEGQGPQAVRPDPQYANGAKQTLRSCAGVEVRKDQPTLQSARPDPGCLPGIDGGSGAF